MPRRDDEKRPPWNHHLLPDPELIADIAAAKQAKDEIIAQRGSLRDVLEFLAARRKINNFGSDLQITFRTRPRMNRDDNGRPAESQ